MKVFFPNRGYDSKVVHDAFNKVMNIPYDMAIQKRHNIVTPNSPPFVFPFDVEVDVRDILKNAARQARAQLPHHMLSMILPQRPILKPTSNLQKFLIRASCVRPVRHKAGCYHCLSGSCPLHAHLQVTDDIFSTSLGKSFKIRSSLNCTSQHVIYVVSCNKCFVQGVGECSSPLSRLPTYIQAVKKTLSRPPKCAIHKHFWDEPHDPQDLELTIVASLPARLRAKPALIPTLRQRLEFIWIHRLDARLNKRRFIHQSFTGCRAARGDPDFDEDADE